MNSYTKSSLLRQLPLSICCRTTRLFTGATNHARVDVFIVRPSVRHTLATLDAPHCGLCLTSSTVNQNRFERLESRDDVQWHSVANQRLSISLCYLFVATLLHKTSSTNRVRRMTLPPASPLGTNRTPQHMQHSSDGRCN